MGSWVRSPPPSRGVQVNHQGGSRCLKIPPAPVRPTHACPPRRTDVTAPDTQGLAVLGGDAEAQTGRPAFRGSSLSPWRRRVNATLGKLRFGNGFAADAVGEEEAVLEEAGLRPPQEGPVLLRGGEGERRTPKPEQRSGGGGHSHSPARCQRPRADSSSEGSPLPLGRLASGMTDTECPLC